VLLLDEPTSSLDLGHAQQVLDLVDGLRRQDGLTVLSTLHDLTLAGQYADRLALLSAGRVAAEGSPTEVLTTAALQTYYGARAEVVVGPDGPAVLPVRSQDWRAGRKRTVSPGRSCATAGRSAVTTTASTG
jgi:iron complex transport system ATP-binding protein